MLAALKKGCASRKDAKAAKNFKFIITFINNKANLDQ